jgi:hypothetical protein
MDSNATSVRAMSHHVPLRKGTHVPFSATIARRSASLTMERLLLWRGLGTLGAGIDNVKVWPRLFKCGDDENIV